MDTKKLRQKILDLAIHGKLVPQDPNDEPASVLLERIKAEKEQLIKEGKIKRQKKSASSDTSHYGNDVPFEVPEGWVKAKIGEVFTLQAGKNIHSQDIHSCQDMCFRFPCYGGNGIRGYVSHSNKIGTFPIIGRQGALCGNVNIAHGEFYATEHAVVVNSYCGINQKWAYYTLTGLKLNQYATATAQPGLAVNVIDEVDILVPPISEQSRIATAVENCFSLIDAIEQDSSDLKDAVQKARSKILDLALSGRLTSHTSHYPKLPDGWKYKRLDEVLGYEQPQKYIVESSEYSDDYTTPVLTAGKSFIIGHTNEQSGICTDVPVIIFDDFTTDSKFVDFPFKVKSSAMKILHPKGDINLKYLAYFMSITRLVGTTHKRYWISEYSKIIVPVPPKGEQDKIVSLIGRYDSLLDSIFMEQS